MRREENKDLGVGVDRGSKYQRDEPHKLHWVMVTFLVDELVLFLLDAIFFSLFCSDADADAERGMGGRQRNMKLFMFGCSFRCFLFVVQVQGGER